MGKNRRMTAARWRTGTDPLRMLGFLEGRASSRKLLLFAVAYCRLYHRAKKTRSPNMMKLFDLIERFADDPALADAVRRQWGGRRPLPLEPAHWAEALAGEDAHDERWEESDTVQAHLLRCLFGNPFGPVALDPSWRTPDVLGLSRAAYEERSSPEGTLDPARLAVLADALEEAGCRDPDALNHLRGPGPHVRGCWVVDLLLARE